MRIAVGLLALAATAFVAAAEDEPEVPPLGACTEISESPFADDDEFFNFKQVAPTTWTCAKEQRFLLLLCAPTTAGLVHDFRRCE